MKTINARLRAVFCAALVAIMLVMTAAPALAVPRSTTLAPYATSDYIVIVDGLHVRKGPGMGYGIILSAKRGTTVTYLSNQYGWWHVRLPDGTTGWVDKQFLTPVTADSTGSYVVMVNSLNVRQEPKTSAHRVNKLKKGDVIAITKLNGDWGYSPSAGGWVALKYLSEKKNAGKTTSTIKAGSIYTVAVDRLNLRASASLSAARVAILKKGVKVKVSQVSGAWAYVTASKGGKSVRGWVATKYIK